MNEPETKELCRVCLQTVREKGMSLFEKYKDFSICYHINAITNMNIKEGDGLPDKICPECLLELETAFNFIQKCESSNILLQSYSTPIPPIESLDVDEKGVVVKIEQANVESNFGQEFLEDLYETSGFCEDDYVKPEEKPKYFVELNVRPSKAIDLHLQCDDCKNYFKSKCKLRVHWKRVHLKDSLKCEDCKRTFKTYRAYKNHKTNKRKSCLAAPTFNIEGQGKDRIFHCKDCDYKTRRVKDIMTHIVVHTGDKPYKCDLCPREFTQQSALQSHMESAHQKYICEITCHICGKYLKGRNRIYRHMKTHQEKGVQCDVCKKVLKNKSSLRHHMQRHSGVKSYTCEICAATFYTVSELSNHKRAIHLKGKYIYPCNLCGYKALRSETLRKHKSRHTATNVPCIICGVFVDNEQKLILHQRRHFEKKHQCVHCNLMFYRKDSVLKHMKVKHKGVYLVAPKPVPFTVSKGSPLVVKKISDMVDFTV